MSFVSFLTFPGRCNGHDVCEEKTVKGRLVRTKFGLTRVDQTN